MADTGLKIVIGADLSAVTDGMKAASVSIGKFSDQATKAFDELAASAAALSKIEAAINQAAAAATGAGARFDTMGGRLPLQDFSKFSASITKLKADISSGLLPQITRIPAALTPIAPAAASATNALNKLQPGANQAGQALINVGRVAQDLPYGFIGIANNLNPLLESFQRLKTETGSSKAALKALGSSLIGAGGLGLALSVVSSAFLIFGNSSRGAKKELEGFDKAVEDSNKKAGEEIARVKILNAVITDTTRTQSDRSKASKELSGILKDLNINMSQEAILNGQVTEATDKATAAILSRAKARAIENRIAELSGQNLQRELERKKVNGELTDIQKKYNKELNDSKRLEDQGGPKATAFVETQIALDGTIKQISNLDKETAKANQEIAFLISQVQDNDLKIKTGGGDDKIVDVLKQRIAALKELQSSAGLDAKQQVELVQLEIKLINRDGPKLGFSPAEIKEQGNAILEKAFPVATFTYETIVNTRVNKLEISTVKDTAAITEDFKTDIAKALGIDGKPLEIPAPKFAFTNLEQTTQDAIDQLNKSIDNIVQNVQVEALSTIGEAIGTALTGGNVGNVFISFFNFLADGLQQLGKSLISYGVALIGFKLAIKSLNPVVAIVAGVAAVAAGAAVKASLPKFADGGIVTGPVIGQVGEMYKPEVIMPLDRLKGLLGSGINSGGDTRPVLLINNEGLWYATKQGERSAARKI